MKANSALLQWSLDVVCPHCNKDIDLSDGDYDYDGCFSHPIFNNKWDDIKKEVISCDECGKEFKISNIIY